MLPYPFFCPCSVSPSSPLGSYSRYSLIHYLWLVFYTSLLSSPPTAPNQLSLSFSLISFTPFAFQFFSHSSSGFVSFFQAQSFTSPFITLLSSGSPPPTSSQAPSQTLLFQLLSSLLALGFISLFKISCPPSLSRKLAYICPSDSDRYSSTVLQK